MLPTSAQLAAVFPYPKTPGRLHERLRCALSLDGHSACIDDLGMRQAAALRTTRGDTPGGHEVTCLDPRAFLTLVSDAGYHCDVWQTNVVSMVDDIRVDMDVVVKCHRGPCGQPYVRALQREHARIKSELKEIIPAAVFVTARIDGEDSALVIADSCNRWFNLANPGNEAELIPMLRKMPRARDQLRRFVHAAVRWRDANDVRVIDLVGEDNLVLTTTHEIRYIDSFDVFFYPDMLHLLDSRDYELEHRLAVSIERIAYVERVCEAVRAG